MKCSHIDCPQCREEAKCKKFGFTEKELIHDLAQWFALKARPAGLNRTVAFRFEAEFCEECGLWHRETEDVVQ